MVDVLKIKENEVSKLIEISFNKILEDFVEEIKNVDQSWG